MLTHHYNNLLGAEIMNSINSDLKEYIQKNIMPQYNNFDKGHGVDHVQKVISSSLRIAKDFDVNINMIFTIAAYHDIGLSDGRKYHHITSGHILEQDEQLKKHFDDQQIILMKQAVEDHRASNDYEPRSIYGKIVAEGDRDITLDKIVYRTMQYGKKNLPHYSYEQHFERLYEHIESKYGENGYLKLWLNTEDNINGLKEIRELLKNKSLMRDFCKQYW